MLFFAQIVFRGTSKSKQICLRLIRIGDHTNALAIGRQGVLANIEKSQSTGLSFSTAINPMGMRIILRKVHKVCVYLRQLHCDFRDGIERFVHHNAIVDCNQYIADIYKAFEILQSEYVSKRHYLYVVIFSIMTDIFTCWYQSP